MSNPGKKRLPFSKTVVVEFSAQLADVLSRTVRLKGSVASPLLDKNAFNNGDVNVDSAAPYEMNNVNSIVILSSFDSFLVTLTGGDGSVVTLQCSGLFIHQGPVAKVSVAPIQGSSSSQIRLQYLWS